jgi:eukaryotic-like serine/threonine-protein kinase
MSSPSPIGSSADQNLLFGILALQMDFVSRDALIAAMNAWVLAKHRALGDILIEQKALTATRRDLLTALVAEHLREHDGDPARSLAALRSSAVPAKASLQKIEDADVQASLRQVSETIATVEDHLATVGETGGARSRFRILRPHAKGGLGEVFVAHDEELNRPVALKEIQLRHASNQDSCGRFLKEAEITGRLEHPGIVPVYGLGTYADGRPYYAMRFIEGQDLREAIERFHAADKPGRDPSERRLTFRELLGRFVAVCKAVAFAHSRGVLHRDLKPGNIMLGKYGETLVVDWGLAKMAGQRDTVKGPAETTTEASHDSKHTPTQHGSALGTPAYMSPEQAAGQLDLMGTTSDVYSLGATLYTLLAGKAPVEGNGIGEILRKTQRGDITPLPQGRHGAPAGLAAICGKAMALQPADRYTSALEIAADVEHWLADERVTAWREPIGVRIGRWIRKHRTAVATALAALSVAVVGLAAVAAVQRESGRRMAEKNDELVQANAQLWIARQGLANKNDELEQTNGSLTAARDRAERRVDLAVGAIENFRSTVDGNVDVKNRSENEGLRKSLLEAPLAFYQKLRDDLRGEAASTPAARIKLADAYFQLGTLDRDIGSQADALMAFDEAIGILEPLFQQATGTQRSALRGRLARTLVERGKLQGESKARTAAALESLRRARDLRQDEVTGKPSAAARIDLAGTLNEIARLEARQGNIDAARTALGGSLDNLEEARRLGAGDGQVGLQLVRTHLGMSSVLLDHQSLLPEALTSALAASRIIEPLVRSNPGNVEYQLEQSLVYESLASIHQAKGEQDKALELYRKQLAVVEEIVRVQPSVNEYKYNQVQALLNVASAQYRRGDNSKGLETLREARKQAETLVRDNPTNIRFKRTLANTWSRSAIPYYGLGRVPEALAAIEKGAELLEEVAKSDPKDVVLLQNIAGGYYNCGILNKDLGKVDAALASYNKALTLRERLTREHPDDPSTSLDVASTLGNMAVVEFDRRRFDEARSLYRRAVSLLEKLSARYPQNAEYENYLNRARQNLGLTLSECGQNQEALIILRDVRERCERMARAHPDVVLYQEDLATGLNQLGKVLGRGKQFDAAVASYHQSIEIREKLLKAHPDLPATETQLLLVLKDLGEVEQTGGRPKDALSTYGRVVDYVGRVKQPSPDLLFVEACCHVKRAGLAGIAGSGLPAEAGQTESDKAVATLRRAVAAGYNDLEELRTYADLEPLRGRDDFKALVGEVEAKTKAAAPK